MAVYNDIQKVAEVLKTQEELLQFDSFNNETAWEFGKFMVEEAKAQGLEIIAAIRKLNGNIVFQYASDGTVYKHQLWMQRKFNTVTLLDSSSLYAVVDAIINHEVITIHGVSADDYVLCGGGFPIRVKGAGITMVVTVSGTPHVQDHDFIVSCLSKYLNIEVPHVDDDIPTVM